jgi:hypothetical protein
VKSTYTYVNTFRLTYIFKRKSKAKRDWIDFDQNKKECEYFHIKNEETMKELIEIHKPTVILNVNKALYKPHDFVHRVVNYNSINETISEASN